MFNALSSETTDKRLLDKTAATGYIIILGSVANKNSKIQKKKKTKFVGTGHYKERLIKPNY